MLQENIWERSLNDEVSSEKSNSILIKRSSPHKLTPIELRNYFNTHESDKINVNSMYDYFGENMFTDYNGLYLPHLICSIPFVSLEKMSNALDEVFQVISPNTGSNTEDNFNYFQYYMLIWRRKNLRSIRLAFKSLYETGIKHGLDVSYVDSNCMSNGFYYAASAPLFCIRDDSIIVPENNIVDINGISIKDIIRNRFNDIEHNRGYYTMLYEELLKYHKIFKSIEFYGFNSAEHLSDALFYHVYTTSSKKTVEWEIYEEFAEELNKVKIMKI